MTRGLPGLALLLLLVPLGGLRGQERPLPSSLEARDWATPDLPGRFRQRLGLRPPERVEDRDRRDAAQGRPGTESPREPRPAPATTGAGSNLVVLVVMASIVVLAAVAAGIFVARRGEEAPTAGRVRAGRAAEEDWLDRGDAARAEGRLGEALRSYYRHGVAALRRAGLVPLAEHTTDGLILARLPRTELAGPFRDLSRRFQPVGYGGRSPEPDAVAAAREDAVRLARRLEEGPEDDVAPR